MVVSFNAKKFDDNLSGLTLTEVLKIKPGVNDYFDIESGDIPGDEYPPVSIRLPIRIKSAQSLIIDKISSDPLLRMAKKSSVLYKYATKLGAIIMSEKDYIKHFQEIERKKVQLGWKINKLYKTDSKIATKLFNDIEVVDSQISLMADDISTIWGQRKYKVWFRPFPRWQEVLDKYTAISMTNKSDMYRAALTYAFATEVDSLNDIIMSFEETMSRLAVQYDSLISVIENKTNSIIEDYGVDLND